MKALLVISLLVPQSAAIRKAAREIVKTFGREAVERAEVRVVRLLEEHGDDAARALRKAGPAGVGAIERHGAAGARILARWGDDGVRLLASEGDEAVKLLARHGDGAVEFMIRHPGVGRDLLGRFGGQALRANVSTEGIVTLNRLAGPIEKSGRAAEIFGVVERFGDRACRFLWRNKGTIFGAALLAAFLSDPEPYLDGVKDLVAGPASAAAASVDWTLIVLAIVFLAAASWFMRKRVFRGNAGSA